MTTTKQAEIQQAESAGFWRGVEFAVNAHDAAGNDRISDALSKLADSIHVAGKAHVARIRNGEHDPDDIPIARPARETPAQRRERIAVALATAMVARDADAPMPILHFAREARRFADALIAALDKEGDR